MGVLAGGAICRSLSLSPPVPSVSSPRFKDLSQLQRKAQDSSSLDGGWLGGWVGYRYDNIVIV